MSSSVTGLKCPHCNYDGAATTESGGTFRYLEDVTSYHEVIRFEPAAKGQPGRLYITDNWDLYLEDSARNQRLECRKCMREFKLPKNYKIEYVYAR